MDQQCIPHTGPSLEDLQRQFERWREHRKRGAPIPEDLWEGAVSLCADHSLYKVSRILHLDYNVLKKRFQSPGPSVTSPDFISLDLGSSLPECLLEMEHAGRKMRLHMKGAPGFDPLELMKTFWERG